MKINGDFDEDYSEYYSQKKEIEKNIQSLQIRRSELEKESIDWTELIEKTLDFAQYA